MKVFKSQKVIVRSDAGSVVQFLVVLLIIPKAQDLAFAVTSDGNIDQLGDGDNGDLSVQDDAEKNFELWLAKSITYPRNIRMIWPI